MGKAIRLATRGSELALKQARMAADWLGKKIPGFKFEIVEIRTSGDKRLDASLEKEGGSGLFTKEIEDALLDGRADAAIHSAKDLPTKIADGLSISCVLPRDWCADVLAIRDGVKVPSLIATGSPRRRMQLKKIFPQAVWTEIRGNVTTRLDKIVSGTADATILSEAGIKRLGIESYAGVSFTRIKPEICVPAVGQGIIAVETRSSETFGFENCSDSETCDALRLEREFLDALGGGCQSAFAANFDGKTFRFFHENSGFQQIKFPEGSSLEERIKTVREFASGLV